MAASYEVANETSKPMGFGWQLELAGYVGWCAENVEICRLGCWDVRTTGRSGQIGGRVGARRELYLLAGEARVSVRAGGVQRAAGAKARRLTLR